MTLIANQLEERATVPSMTAPTSLQPQDVSVVIPVKNNQEGIERFIKELLRSHSQESLPAELIIVDNDSRTPISIPDAFKEMGMRIRVLWCHKPGPAAARNMGWLASEGDWVLFTDSDCVPTESMITGYISALNGSLAYAGNVRALRSDFLSNYYETQEILLPQRAWLEDETECPYLVTANALIWREALNAVGGFNEEYQLAAGEDVDLGLRMRELGRLSFAVESVVYHDFEPSISDFIRRFVRYGRGNRLVQRIHGLDLLPQPFRPNVDSLRHRIAARAQFCSMLWGYFVA